MLTEIELIRYETDDSKSTVECTNKRTTLYIGIPTNPRTNFTLQKWSQFFCLECGFTHFFKSQGFRQIDIED